MTVRISIHTPLAGSDVFGVELDLGDRKSAV